jgi:hypothetical protein
MPGGAAVVTTTIPSLAERARSVLTAASSASVVTSDAQYEVGDLFEDGDPFSPSPSPTSGDLVLRLGMRHPLTQAVLSADDGELTAVVELTQLAAVPARERVRARLALGGWLTLEPVELSVRLDVAEVVLEDDEGAWEVDVDEYRAARPDCLARVENEHLLHLRSHHPDAVTLLARLAGNRALQGAVRVLPVALDRYGLVLRVERIRGHVDVRLPFPAPVQRSEDLADSMRCLLALAAQRPPCAALRTT